MKVCHHYIISPLKVLERLLSCFLDFVAFSTMQLTRSSSHDILWNMKINREELNFILGNISFHAVQMTYEWMEGNIQMHAHGPGSYELHLISEGKGLLRTEGREYPLSANSYFVTGPGIEHEQITCNYDNMHEYCIYFHVTETDRRPNDIVDVFLKNKFWIGDGTSVHQRMMQCFQEISAHQAGYIEYAITLLQQIILLTVREELASSAISHETQDFLQNIYLIIEETFLYDYATVTLKSLSEKIGFSLRQTERLLKEHYGTTFRHMKNNARLSQAKQWLKEDVLSVTEISEKLGYSSVEHFSYTFKKELGLSPIQWRRNILTHS